MVELAARTERRTLELGGDVVATFREGAAGDPDVAAAYEETHRRTRAGIGGSARGCKWSARCARG